MTDEKIPGCCANCPFLGDAINDMAERAEKAEARVKALESGLKSFLFDTANDAIGMSRYMGLGEIVNPDGLKDSKLKFERLVSRGVTER